MSVPGFPGESRIILISVIVESTGPFTTHGFSLTWVGNLLAGVGVHLWVEHVSLCYSFSSRLCDLIFDIWRWIFSMFVRRKVMG